MHKIKVYVCSCFISRIAGSNHAAGLDASIFVCLLVCLFVCVRQAVHSFRGIILGVCVIVYDLEIEAA